MKQCIYCKAILDDSQVIELQTTMEALSGITDGLSKTPVIIRRCPNCKGDYFNADIPKWESYPEEFEAMIKDTDEDVRRHGRALKQDYERSRYEEV